MSGEIATRGMIRAKIPSFPDPASGRENECLTKAEILATGVTKVNGNYGDSECVLIDDVHFDRNNVITLAYYIGLNENSGGRNIGRVKAVAKYPVTSDIIITVALTQAGVSMPEMSGTISRGQTVGDFVAGYPVPINNTAFRILKLNLSSDSSFDYSLAY